MQLCITLSEREQRIKEAAEGDLIAFIRVVAPYRVLGQIHEDACRWWTREDASDHQLTLLPRDHQKSALMGYRVAWTLTRNYISATAGLAEQQLYFIKNILTSKMYKKLWPDMVDEQEGKRERWTANEIIIDHPLRKLEGVRDCSIKTAGLTTQITGLHFTHAVLDDVVVKENAYTGEGRNKVESQYSLLSSIESTGTDKDATGAQEWVVGTRYDPRDLYGSLISMEYEDYDSNGNEIGKSNVYEVFQREVEDQGDGTGEFLWPRQQNSKGKWYGFDIRILAKKRAKYLDKAQFYAQYYNNPNDPTGAAIGSDKFQYYDKKFIHQDEAIWYFKDEPMAIFASIDFAFSTRLKADSTAIVVIGITMSGEIYVLDIVRFKTKSIKVYFENILELHRRWEFRMLRAEVNVAQDSIVEELKTEYIRKEGLSLRIDPHRPTRHSGTKEERMAAILDPRYDNQAVWHYRGGNCQLLEEELSLSHPPHDDVKNALADAIDIAKPPGRRYGRRSMKKNNIVYNARFGGVAMGQR